MNNKSMPEPFGFFRAEPFGWTDCAETDDGAHPLYDKDSVALLVNQRDELQLTVVNLRQQIAHLSDDLAGTKSNVTLAKKRRDDALDELSQISKKLGGY